MLRLRVVANMNPTLVDPTELNWELEDPRRRPPRLRREEKNEDHPWLDTGDDATMPGTTTRGGGGRERSAGKSVNYTLL